MKTKYATWWLILIILGATYLGSWSAADDRAISRIISIKRLRVQLRKIRPLEINADNLIDFLTVGSFRPGKDFGCRVTTLETGIITERNGGQSWISHPDMIKKTGIRARLRNWSRPQRRRAKVRLLAQQQEWLPVCEQVIASLGVKPRPTEQPTPPVQVAATPTATPTATPLPPPSGEFKPVRINCGDFFPYTDNAGHVWSEDRYFKGISDDYQAKKAVNNTVEQQIYMTERYGPAFSYVVPVEEQSASYRVVIHMAEIFWWESGQRVFDIYIEGKPVIANIDLLKAYGAFNPKVFEYLVNVEDGTVDIDLYADVQFGKINGIEILPG
jgi:hypothetical protein